MSKIFTLLTAFILLATASYAQCFENSKYEKKLYIYNQENFDVDGYEYSITISTLNLVTNGKIKADGSDIRFISNECCELIPHYIEKNLNANNTVFYLKLPFIAAKDTFKFRMVYGDHTLTYDNNPRNVFDYYDDFDPNTERLFEEYCNDGGTYEYNGNLEMSWNTKLLLITKKALPISKEYIMESYEINNTNSSGTPGMGVIDSDTEEGYFFARQLGVSKMYYTPANQTFCQVPNHLQDGNTDPDTDGIAQLLYTPNNYLHIRTPAHQYAVNYQVSQVSMTDSVKFLIGGFESQPASYTSQWVRIRQNKAIMSSNGTIAYENNYQKPGNFFASPLQNGEYYFNSANLNYTIIEWNFGDGNTSTDIEPMHTYASNGTYTVCLTQVRPDNCEFTICKEITVSNVQPSNPNDPTTSLNENILANIYVYPNPTNGILNINMSNKVENYSLKVIDMTGREVYSANQLSGENNSIDISKLAKGTYTLVLKTALGQYHKSIVKQ